MEVENKALEDEFSLVSKMVIFHWTMIYRGHV